jgi:hypothetical protein
VLDVRGWPRFALSREALAEAIHAAAILDFLLTISDIA